MLMRTYSHQDDKANGQKRRYDDQPFAFAGAVFYVRLSRCCDMYNALSKETGFPEFIEIESCAAEAKAIIERNKALDEKPLNILTQAAIMTAERTKHQENKEALSPEKASEESANSES